MNLNLTIVLFILQTKKKSKYLVCKKEVNLMNLVCVMAAFNLFLKSRMHKSAYILSTQHNNKHHAIKSMKLSLVFFYIIYFLLKQKKNIFYYVKSTGRRAVFKKYSYKTSLENFFFTSKLLSIKNLFKYYCTFYKNLVESNSPFSFTKYNFELLKIAGLSFHNLYNKFSFAGVRKFGISKGLVSKYCRCILNFKDKRRIIFLSTIRKCLLFLKNKYTYTYKYNIPTYINELALIYDGFLCGVLGNRGQNIANTDLFYFKNSFSNFLKASDYLDSFYKGYYFNVYLKKIKYNFYVTITDRKGGVIFSNSSGKVGLLKKKQKKSMFAINLVVRPVIKSLLKSNILALKNFFCPISLQYISLKVKYFFLRLGVAIHNTVVFNNKSHNFSCRKLKKQRRM